MPLVINGQSIDDSVVEAEFSEIKAYFERLGNVSCCERDEEFRGYARQNVIARVLLAQEARRTVDPTPEAEVDAAVAKLIENYGGEARFFSSTGASREQMHLVRHDVEADLRVQRMMNQLCNDVDPDEATLRQHYQEHLQDFMTAEEVRASHILKAPKRGEARQGAYEELRELRRQLLAGADIEDLARQHSDKADEHIDLGFFKKGELNEEFEAVAFSLNVGEISPVFQSPFGYHLIKLTDRKPAAPRPFDEARDEVRRHYIDLQRQERARKLVDKLQAEATVETIPAETAPQQPAHSHI